MQPCRRVSCQQERNRWWNFHTHGPAIRLLPRLSAIVRRLPSTVCVGECLLACSGSFLVVVAPAHAASHSRGAANSAAASLAGACCKRHPGTLFSVSQKAGRQTAHTSRSVQRRKAFRSCVRRGPLVVMASKMRAGRPRGQADREGTRTTCLNWQSREGLSLC
jgi:hypothetical protein